MKTFLLAALMLTGGCACWTDQEKMNTPTCIAVHDLVDCTTSSVESYAPYFASIIGQLISGGVDPNNINWDDIGAQAAAMGIKDGGCFLAELKNLIFSKAAASPALMVSHKAVGDALITYKLKHFGTATVKFKIKTKDGKEAIL